jgi:hypothetical protein
LSDNIRLKRDKNLRKLDQLFKLDSDTFWKKIKAAQQTTQDIDMTIDVSTEEYKELFNVPFDSTIDKERITAELNEKIKTTPDEFTIIEESMVEEVIKDLKNGKSTGYLGISNEMVKYSVMGGSKRVVEYLTILFNKMIESSKVPESFNISIVKPIIKDEKSHQIRNQI